MKIKDYYPSNILKRLRKRVLLTNAMMRYAYVTMYPRQYELYRIILSYFKGDEKAAKDFIKEYGFVDPIIIYNSNVECIIDESRLDEDFSYILEEIESKKK